MCEKGQRGGAFPCVRCDPWRSCGAWPGSGTWSPQAVAVCRQSFTYGVASGCGLRAGFTEPCSGRGSTYPVTTAPCGVKEPFPVCPQERLGARAGSPMGLGELWPLQPLPLLGACPRREGRPRPGLILLSPSCGPGSSPQQAPCSFSLPGPQTPGPWGAGWEQHGGEHGQDLGLSLVCKWGEPLWASVCSSPSREGSAGLVMPGSDPCRQPVSLSAAATRRPGLGLNLAQTPAALTLCHSWGAW